MTILNIPITELPVETLREYMLLGVPEALTEYKRREEAGEL